MITVKEYMRTITYSTVSFIALYGTKENEWFQTKPLIKGVDYYLYNLHNTEDPTSEYYKEFITVWGDKTVHKVRFMEMSKGYTDFDGIVYKNDNVGMIITINEEI